MFNVKGIQAAPDFQTTGINAVVECKDTSTDYQPFTHEVECQWEPSVQDIGVGEAVEMLDQEIQYEKDVRDVGIQPNVSAFKLDDEHRVDDQLVS